MAISKERFMEMREVVNGRIERRRQREALEDALLNPAGCVEYKTVEEFMAHLDDVVRSEDRPSRSRKKVK